MNDHLVTNDSSILDESLLHAFARNDIPHTDSFVQACCSHTVLVLKEAAVIHLLEQKKMKKLVHRVVEVKKQRKWNANNIIMREDTNACAALEIPQSCC